MKNKNLLLAVLTAMTALWTTGANAQTEYKYSFEVDRIDYEDYGWRVEETNRMDTWRRDGATDFASPHDGNKQMFIPWSEKHQHQDERLVSPAIKLENNATLTFWHFISYDYDAAKGSFYKVEISTDNGETWNELWSVTEGNHYESAITVDLGAYSGRTVNISWHAYENTGKGLFATWCIDDVTVSNVSLCDVVLESCKDKKTAVINVVRDMLDIGSRQAKDLVDSAPCILKKSTTMYYAKNFVNAINAEGGQAKMAPSGMYDPKFVSLFESFEEDGMPEGWTTVDVDNDGRTWEIVTNKETSWIIPFFGDKVISSWSWNNAILDPDNYLRSPLLSDAAELNYWFAMNSSYPDHYQVVVSTTGDYIDDFTQVLIDEKPEGLVNIGSETQSIWYERTLPLPAGTKYVAFRHCNSKDNNYILIDNVRIIKGTATGIETVTTENKAVARKGIYNINGIKMDGEWESMPKGVYVVDGKKKVKN